MRIEINTEIREEEVANIINLIIGTSITMKEITKIIGNIRIMYLINFYFSNMCRKLNNSLKWIPII